MVPEFGAWRSVAAEYRDFAGKTKPRNHPGYGKLHYENATGRNELVSFKAAHSDEFLYVYARTGASITPAAASNWMMLLIRVEGQSDRGWEGYHYIVNRQAIAQSDALLERSLGGWNWEPVERIRYAAQGNELHLAIPLSSLGIDKSDRERKLAFKWADHLSNEGDPMDFYQYGDVAPIGRLNYVYSIGDRG